MSQEKQDIENSFRQNATEKGGTQLSSLIDAEQIYMSQKSYKYTVKPQTKPIHLEPLEEQQKSLFEAFLKGDEKYIYEFDKETMLYREKYLRKASQQGLTIGLYSIGINTFIYTQIFKNASYNIAIKIGSFTLLNAVPIGYFAYKMMLDYNKSNDFLFNKYLKKNI